MAQNNYYDNLDLRYGEVGIAMQVIDRMCPGRVEFVIPVLTPNMRTNTKQVNKVIQKDKSNIQNDNAAAVDVSNIEVSNSLFIEIPREICAMPGGYYNSTGATKSSCVFRGSGSINASGITSIRGRASISSANVSSVSDRGLVHGSGSANLNQHGNGSIDGSVTVTLNGTLSSYSSDGGMGLTLASTNSSRYIPKGSKWLIMFIGGDISCPVVVCRLPDSAGQPVTEDNTNPITYEEINGNDYYKDEPADIIIPDPVPEPDEDGDDEDNG